MDDSIYKIIAEIRAYCCDVGDRKKNDEWANRLEAIAKGIETDCAKIEAMIEMLR